MRITLIANPDNLHVRRWIEFLAGRGHELTLITDPFTKARPAECAAIMVPRWNLLTNILAYRLTPRPYGNDLWKHLLIRPLVRASRSDVVHGFDAFNNGLATLWAGPCPRVLTPFGKDVHTDAFATWAGRFVVPRTVRGVDMISTNDETMPDFLAKSFGIDRARVQAFSWGVDLDVFSPNRAEAARAWRRELEIPADAPVVLSSRNFLPYWGAELLIEAMPRVLREIPGAVFVVLRGAAGDADLLARTRRRAEAEGWAAGLRCVDRVLSPADLAGLFNLAEAFVSIPQTDLLAQTVLEGMACGSLPVLADHPQYRKHARPGENALILREYSAAGLAEALLSALRQPGLRESARRENPQRMAQHENWKQNALKIEDVYAAAIEHYRAARESRR